MDQQRYQQDPNYRRMIEAARKGGQSRSERKRASSARNGRLAAAATRARWAEWRARSAAKEAQPELTGTWKDAYLRPPSWANPLDYEAAWARVAKYGITRGMELDDTSDIEDSEAADYLGRLNPYWGAVFREWLTVYGKVSHTPPHSLLVALVKFRRRQRDARALSPVVDGFQL